LRKFISTTAFIALAAIVILLPACSKKEIVKPSEELTRSERAIGAVKAMQSAYEGRDLKGVVAFVAPEYKKGLGEFETALRKDLETYTEAKIALTVDRVTLDTKETTVDLHWDGSWKDNQGVLHEGRGNSVFRFTETESGPKVLDITGDSPFGVLR
jgi:hypothetical protein